MSELHVEWQWLDAGEALDLNELSRACEMSAGELSELIEYGALSPLDANQAELVFAAHCIAPLRTAGKLRRDYDLDLFTVVLLLDYLRRIETLEGQLRSMQAENPAQAPVVT